MPRIVYREFGNPDPDSPISKSQPQPIRIQATKAGRKGKIVTVVTGVDSQQAVDLLKQLKSHCGSGGTFKEGVIELQGDHRQKVLSFLTALGYKPKLSGG